uniref:Uncharacterized protein n=1 Tax=Anguilla anguilla TaxID=7936 RepID=A0A0E9Q8B9_ANGAN
MYSPLGRLLKIQTFSQKLHTFQSSENRINVCALKDHCSWKADQCTHTLIVVIKGSSLL